MNKQTKLILGVGVVGVAAYLIWKSQQQKETFLPEHSPVWANQTAGTRTGGGFHSTPRFNNPKTKLVRDKSGVGGTDTVYVQHL